jgi:hypothetical protein
MEEKKLSSQVIGALIHFLYNFFIYFLFIVPFDLWKKATIRLSNQRERGGINISKITGLWPFLSFLKTFILEFLIDGIIFILYILGLIIGIVAWISSGEISTFFAAIAGVYFSPIGLSLIRDLLQLLILPFKKFLSWVSKPAQYMDLEIKNK